MASNADRNKIIFPDCDVVNFGDEFNLLLRVIIESYRGAESIKMIV